MSVKKRYPTKEDLKNSLWWWHHSRFAFEEDPVFYKPPQCINYSEWRDWREDGMERVARDWELIRRIYPQLEWPPFYDIGGYVSASLRARVIPESERFRFPTMMTTENSPAGWTDADSKGWRVNLALTEDAVRKSYAKNFLPTENEIAQVVKGSLSADDLMHQLDERKKQMPSTAEHLRWVKAQAQQQGLKLSQGLIGQHNRPPSWALVEVLDIAKYIAAPKNKLSKLTSYERKMKAVATKQAKETMPIFVAAMKDIERMPGFSERTSPEAIARHRKIILAKWEPPKTNW